MDPKFDQDDDDLEGVTRRMRTLAEQPGDLQFRKSIAGAFDKVDSRLGKIDVRLARIEERQINRTTVAEIVKKEMEGIERDVGTLSKMVWGLASACGGALVVLSISKLFGHA